MNRSGSKAFSEPSRGMTWAILQARSSTSNVSTRRAALLPASIWFQACSAPTPNGESKPTPVTTTRLIANALVWFVRRRRRSGRSLVDILDCVADRQDGLGGVVRDLDAEFLFESHDQLDGVEAVRAEVVDEARAFGDLVSIDAQMLDNDFLDAFCGIAHLQTLDFMKVGGTSLAARLPVIKLKDGT